MTWKAGSVEREVSWLRLVNLTLSILAVLAPVAHVLELPSKMSLDANLWLAVQQHLYRGWGPFLGGPAEIGALASSIVLAHSRRQDSTTFWPTLIASFGYTGMLTAFFVLNSPVNIAVSAWKSTMLPSSWTSYRLRWEVGHVIGALLAVISLAALIWAYVKEEQSRRRHTCAPLASTDQPTL